MEFRKMVMMTLYARQQKRHRYPKVLISQNNSETHMLSHWTALGFQREKKKEMAIVKKLYEREVTVVAD